MSEAARKLWGRATSFEELCSLARAFLSAELSYFPGWLAPDVDEETDPIVPALCALTRAGILPLASQPGHPRRLEHDGRAWSRRAFLTAFARPESAARLERVAPAGLVVRSFAAAQRGGSREPVGLRGGEPYLWVGDGRGPEELALFAADLDPRAQGALEQTRYLSVHDEVWGRGEALFGELAAWSRAAPGNRGGGAP